MTLAFLPSPPANGLHLGPLFVHAYGLAYVVALLVAVAWIKRRWQAQGGEVAVVEQVAVWAFPAGLVGGRLYFLATSWNEVPDAWWGPVAIWKGGLSIWGGIAAGTLAGIWVLRRHHVDVGRFMDAAAPALLVGQAIGRVGNYFNQELFGGPSSLPWALEIDPVHRPAGYGAFATFHPTFLYEIVWNLSLAGLLVLLGRSGRVRPQGLFALYVAGYCLGRLGDELLRVDPAHHLLGLRLNFWVAGVALIVGLFWFARVQWPHVMRLRDGVNIGGPAALLVGGSLLACGCAGSQPSPPTSGAQAPRTEHQRPSSRSPQLFERAAKETTGAPTRR